MRVLITGINGFVGGHLAEYLLSASDDEIWGLARSSEVRLPQLRQRVQMVAADLLYRASTEAALRRVRPDVIFHLAAQAHVPTSFADPGTTLTSNLLAELHVLEGVRVIGCDPIILVVCTADEYGAVRPEDLPINEDTPLRPNNPYAVSKVAQDMLALQYYLAHHLRTVRVRPFNHTGPRQEPEYVLPAFARQVARIEAGLQPPVLAVGNLQAQRDFTDVRDMVRAYHLAISNGQPGEVYNIGSGKALAIQALLDGLLALSHVPITVESDPERMRPADVPVVCCDPRRFQRCTGWQPEIDVAQTVSDTLQDWRERVEQTL
ncbi:MAG: GDP-mannose 4,6-dehydratase [Herpetosiphonaceae bacterium]|nr:GDP-mannose 4,6-dehydratase [Herpetosiphonaceae bacterium]